MRSLDGGFSLTGKASTRELLLHGLLRHEVLWLDRVRSYGRDAFGDPEALRLYGMAPSDW